VASHESKVSDWNSLEIGAESVEMIVESAAPKKNPSQAVSMMSENFKNEIPSTRITLSTSSL